MLNNIVKVGKSALKLPAIDSLSSLTSILEGDTEVGAPSTSARCVIDGIGCVADLSSSFMLISETSLYIYGNCSGHFFI
jgi:hypothetical protein